MPETSIAPGPVANGAKNRRPPLAMLVAMGVVIAIFARPLWQVIGLALHSQVYSYIILMPFIVGYLLSLKRETIDFRQVPDFKVSGWVALAGAAVLAFRFIAPLGGVAIAEDDALSALVAAFVLFFMSVIMAFLTKDALRHAAYPLSFLIFLAPFPAAMLDGVQAFLQHLSADVAHGMLVLSGMPLLRDGTSFRLPGLSIEVAPECSGVRSTLSLLITSLVGGYMLLRSPWRRAALAAAIVPLALLRNGFRIFTLAQLCVNVDPKIIDSALHHQGGPIFFALSLIPFGIFLLWLRRSERKAASKTRGTL